MPILSNKNKLNEIQKTALEYNKLRYITYKQKQDAINIMNKEVLGLCKYLYEKYLDIFFILGDDDKWLD